MKLLSIIVPVYNVEQYLERCVASLVGQTYQNKEIILVDDGSKDNSGVLCDFLAQNYRQIVVVHKPNGGLSSARNAGLEIAKGEYIGFVDSDDWLQSDAYEILIENLEKYEADISACDFIHSYGDEEKQPTKRGDIVNVFNRQELYAMTIDPNRFAGYAWNKLYKKSIIGDLRFDETLSSCEDIDFISKLVERCQKGVYEEVGVYHYFHHAQSMTGERNFSYRKMDVIRAYERLLVLYAEKCPERLSVVETNYLKMNINVKGRYLCSKINEPKVLEKLNENIRAYYKLVMRNKAVAFKTKINIFLSRLAPRTALRLKQWVLQKKNQRNRK